MQEETRCRHCGRFVTADMTACDHCRANDLPGKLRHAAAELDTPNALILGESGRKAVRDLLTAAADALDAVPDTTALRDACERLWPYVRVFGLCGADPPATLAVLDLGNALGKGSVDTRELLGGVRQETLEAVTQWLAQHRFAGRHIRRSALERWLKELREAFG